MEVKKKKYVCYGGHVISRNDGDRHYILARRLPILYNINPAECIFVDEGSRLRGFNHEEQGLIPLHPDSSGEYKLPEVSNV